MTAAPLSAQHAAALDVENETTEARREYTSQEEAVAASIQANIADACAGIRKAMGDPALLGSGQFAEELNSRIGYLHQVAEILAGRGIDRRAKLMRQGELGDDERAAIKLLAEVGAETDVAATVTTLRQALGLLGSRPEPEIDSELVAQLEFIRRVVAPKRDQDSLLPVVGLGDGSLLDKLAVLASLDEGGEEEVELADFVPRSLWDPPEPPGTPIPEPTPTEAGGGSALEVADA